nr:MAG: hypothetical protein [Bacteriophage sp.]
MTEIEVDAINEQEELPEKESPMLLNIEKAESNSKQNERAEIETAKEAGSIELLEQLNMKMDRLLEAQQISL